MDFKPNFVGLFFTGKKSRNSEDITVPWSQLTPQAKDMFKKLSPIERTELFQVVDKNGRYIGEWTLSQCSKLALKKLPLECNNKLIRETVKRSSKKGSKKKTDIRSIKRMMRSLSAIQENIKSTSIWRDCMTTDPRYHILQAIDLIREYVEKQTDDDLSVV